MIGTTAHKRRRTGSSHGGALLEPGAAPEAAPSGSPAPSHRLEQTDWNVSPGSGSDSVLDAANSTANSDTCALEWEERCLAQPKATQTE